MDIQDQASIVVISLDSCVTTSTRHTGHPGVLSLSADDDVTEKTLLQSSLGYVDHHTPHMVPSMDVDHHVEHHLEHHLEHHPLDHQIEHQLENHVEHHVAHQVAHQASLSGVVVHIEDPQLGQTIQNGGGGGDFKRDVEIGGGGGNLGGGEVDADPDVAYFTEIIQYLSQQGLPVGTPENYKRIIKKKSQHYSLISGELYYGHKHPKKVVIGRQQQKEILDGMHVAEGTGVHRGVKKMHSAIQELYYWRGMYVDVANYVRRCSRCIEDDLDTPRQHSPYALGAASNLAEPRTAVSKKHLPTDRATRVWKKVELKLYGPYPKTAYQHEYLMTVVDPFSRWVEAQPVPSGGDQASLAAGFLFDCFCRLGFAQCSVVGFTAEMFEAMQARYRERLDRMQDSFRILGHPFEDPTSQQCFVFTLQESSLQCSWAGELLDRHVQSDPLGWDVELDRFLFHLRASPFTCDEDVEEDNQDGCSPFYAMFGRNPTGFVSEEDKENVNIIEEEKALEVPTKRRRLQSSILQCRHCHETFTSKISFRIHQRKHTEEARRRGTLEGEEPLRPVVLEKEKKVLKRLPRKKRRPFGRGSDRLLTLAHSEWSEACPREAVPQDNHRVELTTATVAAVKALLAATKEERAKRGKYQKYTPEMRDEIAKYAIEHGNLEAMRHFTNRLGGQVSESTVRNFVKLYRSFAPETKDEIGRFAYQYGVDAASKHFGAKLGRDVRKGLVRKFKKYYLRKFPDARKQEERIQRNRVGLASHSRQKKTYSPQLKEEMGRHACQFGIPATIQHYTEKLQFVVKESTVRKFKKMYQDSQQEQQEQHQPAHQQQQECPTSTIDILHTSLSVLNNTQPPQMVYSNAYSTIPVHQPVFQQPVYQPQPTVVMNQGFASQGTFQQPYYGQHHQMTQSIPLMHNQHHQMVVQVAPPPPPPPPPACHHAFTQPISTSLTFETAGPSLNADPGILRDSDPTGGVTLNTPRPQEDVTMATAQIPLTTVAISAPVSLPLASVPLATVAMATVTTPTATLATSPTATMAPTETASTPTIQQEEVKLVLQLKVDDATVAEEEVADEADPLAEEEEESDLPPPTSTKRSSPRKKSSSSSSSSSGQKRGNYATYSPELRAEIGKYASEHGNQKAMQHFKQRLGYEIPESTIRGLKDKYLIKVVRGEKEVTTLGFAQRGRPMRLGKYDEIVQDCIRELVRGGEKVSSFLAIATAKQVLMQYEPTLLEDYGGPIKLNPTWAKSFLKRIGLHNSC